MHVTPQLIEHLAQLSGLEIAPAHMPGVIANMATLLDRAEELFASPIEPATEPAPVFLP